MTEYTLTPTHSCTLPHTVRCIAADIHQDLQDHRMKEHTGKLTKEKWVEVEE